MKKITLFLLAWVFAAAMSAAASAATCTWNGSVDSNWATAANWTGCTGGGAPATSDNVLLNNAVVAGSYTINLPAGATSVAINKLTITPGSGSTITLILPTGNTANPGLKVGDNTSGTDDIVLDNGAILQNSSGASAGNGVEVNGTGNGTLRINNGGKYLHNTARNQSGNIGRLSTAAGTETGTVEYDSPGTGNVGITASGATYGNLVLTRSAGAATYTSTGSGALTIKNNFTINGGVTYSTSMTGGLNIAGNLANNGAALSIPGSQAVTFNGTTTQSISGSGSVTFTGAVTVNNSAGMTLNRAVVANGTLTLTSGTVSTGANTLTLGSSATINRTSGYVVGALQKLSLSGAFVFAVGTAGGYTPLDVANATGGGDLTVRTVASTEPHANASTSLKEYWALTAAGSPTVDLTFHYLQADVQGTEANYRIIRVSTVSPFTSSAFPNGCPGSPCVDTANNAASITGVNSFSDWTLGEVISPTAVKLSAARVESYAEGVLVSWESGREVDNLGYNVYRELGGARVRVNPSIVAGSALAVGAGTALGAGAGYQLWDAQGSAAAEYWIEDVDLAGRRTMHGAFAPIAGQGDGARLASENRQPLLLSELNEKARGKSGIFQTGWAASEKDVTTVVRSSSVLSTRGGESSEEQADALQRQWEIAGRAAVKIGVRRDGWYRVTRAELASAGLAPEADPRFLQLYADGRQLPMRVNGSQLSLGADDSIEFYGRGLDMATTDTRIYWLVVGAEPGLRIPRPDSLKRPPGVRGSTKSGVAPDAPAQESGDTKAHAGEASAALAAGGRSFAYTLELKERLIYFSSLLNGDAENYFGRLISSQPVTETLTTHHVAASGDAQSAQLEVALQGVSAGVHVVHVYLNDVEVDRLSFNAQEHAVKVCAVPASLLREGDNSVKLSVEGAAGDISLVDYLRLTYAHAFAAENDSLLLSATDKGALRVDGFTAPNVRVLDVTDSESVTELSRAVEQTPDGYTALVQTRGGRTLLAFADDAVGRAASVTPNQPSAWHADVQGADMVIITHHSLGDSVQPLRALRESEGLRVSVIDAEDIFDEFAYGAHTPQAIKDFLQWTTTHWRQPPHYALFVGDASIDPRDYEGRGDFDLVPTKLIDTASMETASDEWFADFADEGAAQTMALGRLPVRTPQEAATVIAKIVNFTPESANKAALLVSDHSGADDLNFAAASQSVAAQLSADIATTFVNRDDGAADAVRGRVVSEINAGPSVVNFMGHGSTTFWTGGQLLRASDAAALSNGSRLPLFVMMTCLSGYFTGTTLDSLSEAVLKSPHGGAVAVWASSGMTVPVEQQTANRELYRQLFGAGQPPALGDAVRQAKLATQDQDIRRTWILFGDPSMRWR